MQEGREQEMLLRNNRTYKERVVTTVLLDADVHEALRKAAEGRHLSDVVNEALRASREIAKHLRCGDDDRMGKCAAPAS